MSLPIDPEALTGEDIGEKQATLEMGHQEAVEFVRECCKAAGFGIPVEFSPSDMLNEKVDANRDPYYVLGACNPEMADRVLDASANRAGAIMPCNVVIWEEKPGRQQVYHVSIMRVARLTGMAPEDETMAEIIADTGELVTALFEEIEAEAV